MRYGCGLLVALICACGGGGTTGGGNGGTSEEQEAARQALQDCGATFYGDFARLLTIFQGLLDPAETNPETFAIDSVDTDLVAVNWSLDLDGDSMPDVIGTLLFATEEGDPETNADVTQLAGGFDDLDTFIAGLPDGTRLNIAVTGAAPPPPITDVNVTFVITSGAADTVSAVAFADVGCLINLDFDGVAFANLAGAYPNLTANLSVAAPDAALVGTIAFNGSGQARIEVTIGGEPAIYAFNVDLQTGDVTIA